MTKLVFTINAAARQISRVKQGDMPDDMIDFCTDAGPRTVVTGRGLSLDTGDTVKLELCPNKGAAIAVLDQLRDIQASPDGKELSFLNYVNSSSRPDMHLCRRHQVPRRAMRGALRKQSRKRVRDWWGQDVLLTITIGGIPTTRWLTFKNWYYPTPTRQTAQRAQPHRTVCRALTRGVAVFAAFFAHFN